MAKKYLSPSSYFILSVIIVPASPHWNNGKINAYLYTFHPKLLDNTLLGLTCCDDVKNTRYSLMSYSVRGVTEKSSVILFCNRCVRHHAWSTASSDVVLSDVDRESRAVEGPLKLDVRWVGFYLTRYLRFFFLGDSIDSCLIRSACWRNCKNRVIRVIMLAKTLYSL